MEAIIQKLDQLEYNSKNMWSNWSKEEIIKMLEMYLVITKKENYIYDLVYQLHGSDSYEDIFRDYDDQLLEDKASGIKEALDLAKESDK